MNFCDDLGALCQELDKVRTEEAFRSLLGWLNGIIENDVLVQEATEFGGPLREASRAERVFVTMGTRDAALVMSNKACQCESGIRDCR